MGKSLKTALLSQQSRQKQNEKAKRNTEIADAQAKAKKQSLSQGKGKGKAKQTLKPAIPFSATDTILLIGEGNFSFARALVEDAPVELAHLPANNITATAYDSEDECYSKYPDAQDIVRVLRERGVQVLFNIDASKLDHMSVLKDRRWDKICWNFPHAGKGITDLDRNILSNQVLILNFLRTAEGLLKKGPIPSVTGNKRNKRDDEADDKDEEDEEPSNTSPRGTILITLRNVTPYTLWDVPKLAKHPPAPASSNAPSNPSYILLRSFTFLRSTWKGYEHRMTKGERAHGTGRTGKGGEDRTWEFCINNRA